MGQTDKGPPPFLPCPIFPYLFFYRDHKELRHFPALEVSILLQVFLPVICEAQIQMSKPPCRCLHPELSLFHTYLPTLVFSFYIIFGFSLILKWIFQLISHLLYLPPPSAHFSSSFSSCLFSFFSYNPVHLDNFHLDCLT